MILDHSLFTFVKKCLVAEASDLNFGLISTKQLRVRGRTGRVVAFHLDNVQRCPDGDIAYWEFAPRYETTREHPELSGIYVRIYND